MEKNSRIGNTFASIIVASQWLQAPLYFGLIVAQGIYVFQFCKELYHLVCGIGAFKSQDIMLMVLGLIDVVMISNLLIMVIIGGYHTFVAKIHFSSKNPPDWLDHVNASTMKVKLSMALIGISSIHLLFIISAIGLAHVARLSDISVSESRAHRKAVEPA